MPVLPQAVNAEPPHLYSSLGSSLPTMCLRTPWPFPLPWLSPLGAARREVGGRWMAEPFLSFGESLFSPVVSFKMRSGLSQTPTARSAALGRWPESLQLFRQTKKRRIEAVILPLSTGSSITEAWGSKLVSQKIHTGCWHDGSRLCWPSDRGGAGEMKCSPLQLQGRIFMGAEDWLLRMSLL